MDTISPGKLATFHFCKRVAMRNRLISGIEATANYQHKAHNVVSRFSAESTAPPFI